MLFCVLSLTFLGNWQGHSKTCVEIEGPRITKTIWKKNEVGELNVTGWQYLL